MGEYKTLRDESLQAQRQQQEVVRVGFSAIALLTGFAATVGGQAALPPVLLAGVPLLAIGTAVIWLGELRRMVRAGVHLARREGEINAVLRRGTTGPLPPLPDALGWEEALRAPAARLGDLYMAVFLMLAGLGTVAVVAGLVVMRLEGANWWLTGAVMGVEAVGAVGALAYFFIAYRRVTDQGGAG